MSNHLSVTVQVAPSKYINPIVVIKFTVYVAHSCIVTVTSTYNATVIHLEPRYIYLINWLRETCNLVMNNFWVFREALFWNI